ncbi:uncharacterized protein [Littorina saxatilis]
MARYGMRSSFGYSRSVTIFRRSPQCPERFPCTHSTMHRLTATLLAFFFAALVLVSSSNAGPVPEASSSRNKRQFADVKAAEYLAWIALGGWKHSHGCIDIACGLVDVYFSGKRKRDNGHEQRYTLLKNLIERAAENNMPQN